MNALPLESPPLHSRMAIVFTGLSYLFTGFGFSFLDRRYGSFGMEDFLWLVWAVLGFGAGAMNLGKSANTGKTQWIVMGSLGGLLALFPGFVIYNLLRWTALTLMIVVGARAAVVKTRRDFYLTLIVIFVVSFMVGTHFNADWTLWFYLGPAWGFGGLALAWDHAAGTALSRRTKLGMTLGFITLSFVTAMALFFFAPRPPILGFGFLPPGTDTPGMFKQPAGDSGTQPGKATQGKNQGDGATGSASSAGDENGSGNTSQQGEWAHQWKAMLKGMRKSASDKTIPQWQRSVMGAALDAGELMLEQRYVLEIDLLALLRLLLWMLLLLLIGYWLWRERYHIGLQLALSGAWLTAKRHPKQSMRLSAQAMKWCLHLKGHKHNPGQSVREHWIAAASIAPLARRWLGYAVESYCAMRFGNVPATQLQAVQMRKAVMGASDILQGAVPELAK